MNAAFALRRRNHIERRALLLMRGAGPRGSSRAREPCGAFDHLRVVAVERGLRVQPPASPFVSEDELRLLFWIAAAQRAVSPMLAEPADPDLADAILLCATLLNEEDLRLPPLTLYGARLHDTP